MSIQPDNIFRVLLVEDNASVSGFILELLELDTMVVDVASDGEEGLKLLASQNFDLIITDLGLPGISGWEVILASQKLLKDTPVMVITSWQDRNTKARLERMKVDYVLWKPFRVGELRDILSKLRVMSNKVLPVKTD